MSNLGAEQRGNQSNQRLPAFAGKRESDTQIAPRY
jgi:hypothetical protein